MATLSSAQQEAQRQAQQTLSAVQSYQTMLPVNYRHHDGGGICRADGWDVSVQQLSGEYDLDDVLAQQIVASALGPTVSSITADASALNSAKTAAETAWLKQYLYGDPAGSTGSVDRLLSEGRNATAGPGNVLGNANEIKKTINAAVDKRTSDALLAAVRKMQSGPSSNIKINQYMTLYNANTSGKGRPRPRLRIAGLPMQVITPALGEGARMAAQYGSVSARVFGASKLEAHRLGKFAAGQHWSSTASSLNGWKMGGVLTFAPSAALDAYSSYEQDFRGDSRFNWHMFGVASAKSQSGNLLGAASGAIAMKVIGATAVGMTTLAGAPLILIGLGVGITVQLVWGWQGGSDWAGASAQSALK
jgi:hypothetical protein